ncbi:hypothetical protein EVG20_g4908 [Dentipellis fragilis]|uniref:Uncharacterized protein n=1 Tax=Dentipellis fragilis TaxID=205917 RepID=A0A4Y9YX80_9AGAM|nr:hypothetical protein EVG20_g4908 [Dentipellis fragilis]
MNEVFMPVAKADSARPEEDGGPTMIAIPRPHTHLCILEDPGMLDTGSQLSIQTISIMKVQEYPRTARDEGLSLPVAGSTSEKADPALTCLDASAPQRFGAYTIPCGPPAVVPSTTFARDSSPRFGPLAYLRWRKKIRATRNGTSTVSIRIDLNYIHRDYSVPSLDTAQTELLSPGTSSDSPHTTSVQHISNSTLSYEDVFRARFADVEKLASDSDKSAIEAARRLMNDDISTLQKIILSILSHHNRLICRIHRLPPEILARIFNLTIQGKQLLWHTGSVMSSFETARRDGHNRYQLMSVCHHWWNVILGDPSCWENITDGLGTSAMKAALYRSKSLPLTITRAVHSSYESPLLAQHLARIKELGLYLRGEPQSIQGAHESLNAPADNLETLFLAQRVSESHGDLTVGNSCTLPSGFLAAHAPKLRRISLYNYPAPAGRRKPSSLQQYTTNSSTAWQGFLHCRHLFSGAAYLTTRSPPELSDNRPVINMGCLQKLSIDDRAWPAAGLLGRLTAPACTSLKLKIANSSNQSTQRNYELLAQMLKKSSIAVDVPSRPIQTVRVCVQQMGQQPWLTVKGWSILHVADDGYPVFQPKSEPSFDFTLDMREGPRPKMEEAVFMAQLRHILAAIPPANVSTLSLELPHVRNLDCGDSSTQMVFGALARHGGAEASSTSPASSGSDDIFLRNLEAVSVPEAVLNRVSSHSQTFFGDILVPKLRCRKEMGFPLQKLYIVRPHPGFPHYSWVENIQQIVPVFAHVKSKSHEESRAPQYSAQPPGESPTA